MYQKKFKEDKQVTCPYYHKEGAIEIICDGVVGCSTTSSFKTKADKEDFKYDFCKSCYQGCPICIELEKEIEEC